MNIRAGRGHTLVVFVRLKMEADFAKHAFKSTSEEG
jgi:RNA:NAD 2'-phosphotransferase (TPT1/KptA family)